MFFFFFFNDTATTEIYTLSLHDALPIYRPFLPGSQRCPVAFHSRSSARLGKAIPSRSIRTGESQFPPARDRKSTRLNSSHRQISYAVFCLKKKNTIHRHTRPQRMKGTDR